jgi:serine protease
MFFRPNRRLAVLLPALLLALGSWLGAQTGAQAAEPGLRAARAAVADAEDPDNARVIVKYRSGSSLAQDAAGHPRHAARLGKQMALALQDGHVLGQRTQSLRARGLTSSALAARLAANPEVEWAVPARRKTFSATLGPTIPNDPFYADGQTSITPAVGQWYLRAPDTTIVSAINAVGAWSISTGAASVTVAVLDTGVLKGHPDFVKADGSSKLWPGYDFVSRSAKAGDGDGRDADPSDPGDWTTAADGCAASNSSWHGTQVAGLIGAASDNGIGMASVGRDVMVLPVRVLGKCGGFDDDIIAGMLWAAGASSDPVANPNPARVINLSLGSSGNCSVAYQDAINRVVAAPYKVAVVVAAGNDTGHAVDEPANCNNVIAVSGLRHAGTKVGYSNIGPQVAIAAPAGNCVNETGACLYPLLTTTNAGTTAPGAHTYSSSSKASLGTSFAAPIVAGTVGLMLSVDPKLTPTQVKAALQATARAFPTTGAQEVGAVACVAPTTTDQIECYCTTSTCGAGMLDAGGAVAQVQAGTLLPVAVISASTTSPTVGDSVTLSGTASTASAGRTIAGYQWAITSGAGLASLVGATNGTSVTLTTSAVGTVAVQLTVTDSVGAIQSSSQSITIAAVPVVVTPPAASGGGGGAMGGGWVLGCICPWPQARSCQLLL